MKEDGRARVTISASVNLGGSELVGDLTLMSNGSVLAPRPFQGDVVCHLVGHIDQIREVATGRQPLDAVLLADNRLVARDWRTGELLIGAP